jgi:multidrug efflux pump subunit AcrA (membrane-fusion protein)
MTRKSVSKIIVISLSAMMALSGCGGSNDKKGDAKDAKAAETKAKGAARSLQAVSVQAIELESFSPRLVVAGQVQAINEARVFPTASGARVLQVLADAGDRVNAGQALARLDGRQISADSELLAAQVRRARTALANGCASKLCADPVWAQGKRSGYTWCRRPIGRSPFGIGTRHPSAKRNSAQHRTGRNRTASSPV